jgi:beta-glucosidase
MGKAGFILLFLMSLILNANAQNEIPVYKDKNAPIEKRIDDLLQRMTLEEKVMQTSQLAYGENDNPNNAEDRTREINPMIGSVLYRTNSPVKRNQIQKISMEQSRLGIPIIFGFDVIHGYRTIFPISLAQSCSWNTNLVKESCRIAAKESWLSGLDWTFSPMIDVARDPRWGRVAEGYGEDPYANSVFCVAAVEGYQGKNLNEKYTIAACLKHYIGYSLSESGRDYHYTDVSDQTLWETFIPPYEAGVKAGAATLMSGFNDLTGIPASANHYTLTEILKEKWGHDGFVVSDWASVRNLTNQGFAKDRKEAGLKAFMAGVEMDMVDNIYLENLPELVAEGKVPMSRIDDAVRRILRIKYRLGLFDHPYVDELPENERNLLPEYLKVAEQLAAESMVLLKNEQNILPLTSSVKNIAFIGPMVYDSLNILGSWDCKGLSVDVVSIYDGVKKEFGKNSTLHFAKGSNFDGNDSTGFAQAREEALMADVVVLLMGEKRNWSGENSSRSSISLPTIQEQLIGEIYKLGKPVVLVLSSGRPLELIRVNKKASAIIEMWQPGTMGGAALSGILSGKYNPSGKLSISFPQNVGQIPVFYNARPTAVLKLGNFQDVPKEPMYAFGYGLSYSSFTFGVLQLSADTIRKSEKLKVEVEVTNTSSADGKETVLWFISDPFASITRPMKELKFFEKKEVGAGEKVDFTFEIDPMRDLSFPDKKGNRILESGEFYIMVNDQKVKFELID